jgi:hypothetical protein
MRRPAPIRPLLYGHFGACPPPAAQAVSSGFKHLRPREAPHAIRRARKLREECGSCVNSGQRLIHSGY